MKISLVIPTNRSSYSAAARVLECASLDPNKFELIVRDNSENEDKRAILARIDSPALRLFTVPNSGPFENGVESMRLATGDFVLVLADDDWLSTRGVQQLHALAEQVGFDESVSCLTGTYLIEMANETRLFRYSNLESTDPAKRVSAFLDSGINVFYYSAIRRRWATFCFALVERLPYKFSYHDHLVSLLYLVVGRTCQIDRVLYSYDLGKWETAGGCVSQDQAMYVNAGLPVEIDRLHWLLCTLEGCYLLNSKLLSGASVYDRQQLIGVWFANMFARFKHDPRESDYEQTAMSAEIKKLKDKVLSQQQVDMGALLGDVCKVIEIADPAGAQRYFKFWSSL